MLAAVLFLGELDAALDLAHVVEIFGYAIAVVRAQAALQMADLRGHRVQDAALALDAGQALGGVGSVAKQAIEHHTRVDFHGQRRGGRAPRDGVGVGAAEADVAGADQAGHIFGGQFERRQRRVLADVRGGNLIHRGARANVLAFGALGMDAVQEDGGGASVVATAIAGAECAPASLCARLLTTTTWSRCCCSGIKVRERSKSEPSAAGVQLLITAPCGM